jgi:hypothetical protein
VIVSVPTKRGPEFVGFLAEGDSPPFRIAGRECMHDFGADAPSPKLRRHLDELDQGCGRTKPFSAFVLVDVHGVIKIDTCNVDTVTENLYIPRVVDQAGRIVTPARGEVVARMASRNTCSLCPFTSHQIARPDPCSLTVYSASAKQDGSEWVYQNSCTTTIEGLGP